MERLAARPPVDHDDEEEDADDDRDVAAVEELREVRQEERDVEREEEDEQRDRAPGRPVPRLPGHLVEDEGRDRHRAADRDAVRRREPRRLLEADDEADARDHQPPVEERDVDLPLGLARRVVDGHAREVAELDRLVREREDAADERLRGDRGGHRGERDEEIRRRALGDHREERVRERGGVAEDERALPQVREEEAGEDEREPGEADGPDAEVPHVGVERLAARDREDDHAEDGEPAEAVVGEVERAPVRGERAADLTGPSAPPRGRGRRW